nr:PREDICTED: uncharacterized protein LOC107398458 [Tribolium castaneum]|eukprot:XP_015838050.1 PREDICTED: uncharacterized protein LOC107398458 [Tribolium castaneum]
MSYTFTTLHSWEFYKKYSNEYFLLYVQFLTSVLVCTILGKLKSRYESIKGVLIYHISRARKFNKSNFSLVFLQSLKYDLSVLKDGVDSFNVIFGWPFLLIFIFVSLQDLAYLDSFFKLKNPTVVLSNFLMMAMITLEIAVPIWLCDLVVLESEEILAASYRLQRYLNDKENSELEKFIKVAKANFPKFSAARFCLIERNTLYKIFETVSTVLIIMIQFNPDLKRNVN